MTGSGGSLSIPEFNEEVVRQRHQFWLHYRLRWIFSWAVVAFVLGRPKAGWYLARGNKSGLCTVMGPFNTWREAFNYNHGYPIFTLDTSTINLLWEEPPTNRDDHWRTAGRPWYRLPARTRK